MTEQSSASRQTRLLIVSGRAGDESIPDALLKASGVQASRTTSGREGLEILSGGGFDLVLIDLTLTGAPDAVETARLARERFDLPVVFLVSTGSEEKIPAALEVDPFGCLEPPLSGPTLKLTLETALRRFEREKRWSEMDRPLADPNEALQREIEKRWKVEESLCKIEEDMRLLMENATSFAVYQLAYEETSPFLARVVFVSPSLREIACLEDLYDLGAWFERAHPEDAARIMEANIKAWSMGGVLDEVARVWHPVKDEWRWLRIIANGVLAPDDSLTRCNGIILDLTETYLAQEKLKWSEQRYRALAEAALDAVFVMDRDGVFRYVNSTMASNFQTPPEKLTGSREAEFIAPETAEAHRQWVGQVLDEGRPLVVEEEVSLRGEPRWFETRLTPLADNNAPAPTRVLGISRDITNRKRNDQERLRTVERLQQSQADLESVLRAARAVLEQKEFEQTARTIFEECRLATGAEAGYVALLSEDETENEIVYLEAGERPCLVDTDLPMPIRGLREIAYRETRTVFENDFDRSEWAHFLPAGHVTLDNVMFIPLVIDGRAQGVIGLANKPAPFDDEDALKVAGLGELAALALKNSAMQDSLLESESRFRGAFEQAGVGMALVRFDGGFIQVNAALAGMTGRSEHELLRQKLTEIAHPEDGSKVWDVFRRVLAGEVKSGRLEHRLIHRDGNEVWCEHTTSRVTDASGQTLYAIVQMQNITQKKLAEAELRKLTHTLEDRVRERTYQLEILGGLSREIGFVPNYHELFRLMMSHLEDVMRHDISASLISSGGGFTFYIRSQRPLPEEVADGIKGRLIRAFNLLSPVPEGVREDQIRTQILSPESMDPQAEPLRSPASSFQVPMIVGPKRTVAGLLLVGSELEHQFTEDQIQLLYTVANQASEAVGRLDERLRLEQTHMISIIENLPHGVILLDRDHRIIMTNSPAVLPLMALTSKHHGEVIEELAGLPLSEILPDKGPDRPPLEIIVDGPPRQVFEAMGRRLMGGLMDGGAVLSVREITEEAALTERIHQQDRLAAVGQLAAGIAHDFNNLLTSIGGYSELLATDPLLDEETKDTANIIRKQVRRAAQLIRQILDFSRKSISDQHPLELISFMKESEKLLRRTISETISIEFSYEAGEYMVHADPVGLQQVITNLAVNARDAMPEGGRLRFHLKSLTVEPGQKPPVPEMPVGDWAVMSVVDNGTGIPADILPKVFDPFFSTKPVGRGTGLGLAQVFGIVNSHKGFIDISTRVGQGAKFNVYLPLTQTEERRPDENGEIKVASGARELILLVEDEPMVLNIGRKMLKNIGYRVLTASNGREALEIFNQNAQDIDLVLTDLVMPQMGGRDLIRSIHQTRPDMKVIVWTGYPLDGSEEMLKQGVISDWIMKPPELEVLAEKIRKALTG